MQTERSKSMQIQHHIKTAAKDHNNSNGLTQYQWQIYPVGQMPDRFDMIIIDPAIEQRFLFP